MRGMSIEFQIMILARPEGGIGVISRTYSTSSTIPTDNVVQNLYLEVYTWALSIPPGVLPPPSALSGEGKGRT